MANNQAPGNSSMEHHRGHAVEPISSPATAHLLKIKLTTSMTLTAFAYDHSICNNFKAGDKEQEHKVKTDLEKTFTHLKQWMDMMCLKLNPDKMEYILFGY